MDNAKQDQLRHPKFRSSSSTSSSSTTTSPKNRAGWTSSLLIKTNKQLTSKRSRDLSSSSSDDDDDDSYSTQQPVPKRTRWNYEGPHPSSLHRKQQQQQQQQQDPVEIIEIIDDSDDNDDTNRNDTTLLSPHEKETTSTETTTKCTPLVRNDDPDNTNNDNASSTTSGTNNNNNNDDDDTKKQMNNEKQHDNDVTSLVEGSNRKDADMTTTKEKNPVSVSVAENCEKNTANGLTSDKPNDNTFFQTHCWICQVPLVSDEDQICCYAMHTHPILHTPLCSVCYETIEDVLYNRTACVGCGEEAEISFLCDNILQNLVCPNEFCFECVRKAGLDPIVLQSSQEVWHCLACSPPPTLQTLCVKDGALPSISERTTEDIIHELEVAEEKKRECEEALEDVNVERKYQEILHELEETVSKSEIEEAAQEELDAWKELQIRHDARLGDFISKLQDELESRGLDMATLYHTSDYLSILTPTLPEVAPEWVQRAHTVNDQREQESSALPIKPILPAEEYKKDFTDDVEEIAEINDITDHVGCKGSGWVHSKYKPTLGEFREAQEKEDEERARRKINKKISRRTETHDRNLMKDEGPRIRNKDGRMVVEHKVQRSKSQLEKNSASPSRRAGEKDRPIAKQSFANETPFSQESEIISTSDLDRPFIDSDVLLCTPSSHEALSHGLNADGVVRKVSIAMGFARVLKEHQKDGVKFMWKNSFCDFENHYNGNDSDERVGGCILAHHMGLGKTLTTITLLHTVLTHPSMVCSQNNERLIRTVVLVVPLNTLANWKDEFTKWFVNVDPKMYVYTPCDMETSARKALISKWMTTGGIFLVTSRTLLNSVVINGEETDLVRANVLVVDEAHSMIKNPSAQIFKALSKFVTKRRVLLSGSPFQNNLFEYYHICNFIRDGVFGILNRFKVKFADPITSGQAKDATQRQKALTAMLSADLRKQVDPHIHRRDLSVLEKELPKLSQVVIHVRPSRTQSKIYRTFERARKSNGELRSFLKMYSELGPVHNHPSCLLDKDPNDSQDLWCKKHLASKAEVSKLEKITAGNKFALLLHLLAYAEVLGEKVLIFSQYLVTLDRIEALLQSEDWISQLPSLSCFSGQRLGGWKKNQHYLRIDGSTSSMQRGQSINAFNEDGVDGDLRAFLISTRAGSLGINLTSASRVVLVDSHFNPTVMTQAVFRAYRYGQQKPVHCYRLLTEGTMEEKVYGRSVNKTGLALRLIDSKAIERCFSAKELEDFQQFDEWVQCDRCEKWRMLSGESAEDLPEKWYCEMNTDEHNNSCDRPERDQAWYYNVCKNSSPGKEKVEAESIKCQPEQDDELLSHLLSISESSKGTSLISRHYYHDSLLQASHDGEEVEHARILLANEAAIKEQGSCGSEIPIVTSPIEIKELSASSLSAVGTHATNATRIEPSNPYGYVPSLGFLLGNDGAVEDWSSDTEDEKATAADPIPTTAFVASDRTDSSKPIKNEMHHLEKMQDVSNRSDGATELLKEKPVPQAVPLPISSEIIDLCDNSDDNS